MGNIENVLAKYNKILNDPDYRTRIDLMASFVYDIEGLVRTPPAIFEQLMNAVIRDWKTAGRSAENTRKLAEKLHLPEILVELIEEQGDQNFRHNIAIMRAWIEAWPHLRKVFGKHIKTEGFFFE